MKRIFIALPLPKELTEKILDWQKAHKDLPAQFIKEKNLHITVIPPWRTDDINAIIAKLKTLSNQPKQINITLTDINSQNKLQMIWAEGQTPPEILTLKTILEETLNKQPEARPFRLHITIASKSETDIHEAISWTAKLDSFVLMESLLFKEGAKYLTLETFHL
ncbi:MAG: 2'-5' RNA ligase family protein [Candidatus Gracilibacteria bacterium]